jgi:hypothetical protein
VSGGGSGEGAGGVVGAPICSGHTKDGRACPVPATTSSGKRWCFRHDPANRERLSVWASDASKARDGHLRREVRGLLGKAQLDSLDNTLSVRRVLWRIAAANLMATDKFRALDGTLADFIGFYVEQERRREVEARLDAHNARMQALDQAEDAFDELLEKAQQVAAEAQAHANQAPVAPAPQSGESPPFPPPARDNGAGVPPAVSNSEANHASPSSIAPSSISPPRFATRCTSEPARSAYDELERLRRLRRGGGP